jgi:hypothetical protein
MRSHVYTHCCLLIFEFAQGLHILGLSWGSNYLHYSTNHEIAGGVQLMINMVIVRVRL